MSHFDWLAEQAFRQKLEQHWQLYAEAIRAEIDSPNALTGKRKVFLERFAIQDQQARTLHVHAPLPPGIDTARQREAASVLGALPPGSARLLLTFTLETPLLTRDDTPFHLFDNPVRKDHVLQRPYLAAATLKGLAVDAYQRAFPGDRPWAELGADEPTRARRFREQDASALRLFGSAEGNEAEAEPSQIGRLRWSAVWFEAVQYLVLNPQKSDTSSGSLPLQMEALAPGQTGHLELLYIPCRAEEIGDEAGIRRDLARLLAALADWWPALGLGAKRLAGYGQIQPGGAQLQARGWSFSGEQAIGEHTAQGWEAMAQWLAEQARSEEGSA